MAVALGVLVTVGCYVPRAAASLEGGQPNFHLPTMGGLQLWADVAWADGWRVQRHVWTRHHRLLDPSNVRRAWGGESHCTFLLEFFAAQQGSRARELVILVHGLGRTRYSLRAMREALEEQGHRVVSLSYPSTRASLDEHASGLGHLLDSLHDVDRVSFVTHSLGGRVVLRLLDRGGDWMSRIELGGVVQIAPPNRGSQLAVRAVDIPLLGWVFGPSLHEVALPDSRAPSGSRFGVLAGVRGTPCGWNSLLHGDDDGVVALSETRLDGPHEHRTVRGMHTFLMNDPSVLDATARFLAEGTFGPE